jgi:hypothetical protein
MGADQIVQTIIEHTDCQGEAAEKIAAQMGCSFQNARLLTEEYWKRESAVLDARQLVFGVV